MIRAARLFVHAAALLACGAVTAQAQHWPAFRGAHAEGVSAGLFRFDCSA